jgi:hypothetical protein
LGLTFEDAAADGHVGGEGALLVNVVAVDSLIGGLEAKADVLEETLGLALLGVEEHAVLLLEGPLGLRRSESGRRKSSEIKA